MTSAIRIPFDNSYARDLEGFYVPWNGMPWPEPRMIQFNRELAEELGLDASALGGEHGALIFSGKAVPEGASPLAMAYAGHQFGGFSPQLGDGRALLLGEVIDRLGNRRDIHLKGSGPTPFSRGGDGKAVLGPVLREYLMGEAMHALGIPTTRALAALTTGETVIRQAPEPGAVLARVASSHLRVGTFQFFAARGESEKVRQLADYAIARHYPELEKHDGRYLGLLEAVMERQAALIARWMLAGFVHGVMNTDNMAISGETIDYGPCAFMDAYHPNTVFSSIDEWGRYAYANQPVIAQWNLARLAECLLELIAPGEADAAVGMAKVVLDRFPECYQDHWLAGMRGKLGLSKEDAGDFALANDLFAMLEGKGVDFTLFFRALAKAADGDDAPVKDVFADRGAPVAWLQRWHNRLEKEDGIDGGARAAAMNRVNPLYIPRNHKVEEALGAATAGDFEPFRSLLTVVSHPFEERNGLDAYAQPAPDSFGPYVTYCGT